MKLEFSSNLCLREDDIERYQFIYATQLYETLFGVYGKFNVVQQGDSSVITSIDFIGINYKGPITLSVFPQFDQPTYATDSDSDRKMLEMNLYLQAGKSSPQNINSYVVNLKELYPDETFTLKNNDYLKIQRKLVPMVTDNKLPVSERAFSNGQFDSEFYERDGLYVKEKPSEAAEMTGGNLIFNHVKENPFGDDDSDDRSLGTIRCTPGICKVCI
ncbi:MAG: hypothetical protein AAFQ94_17330 [Bacteroidota bacterium]